jgi:hypothetical protein
MLVYFVAIWSILESFWYILWSIGKLMVIWYIFPRFGAQYQGKSGNPVLDPFLWYFNFFVEVENVVALHTYFLTQHDPTLPYVCTYICTWLWVAVRRGQMNSALSVF